MGSDGNSPQLCVSRGDRANTRLGYSTNLMIPLLLTTVLSKHIRVTLCMWSSEDSLGCHLPSALLETWFLLFAAVSQTSGPTNSEVCLCGTVEPAITSTFAWVLTAPTRVFSPRKMLVFINASFCAQIASVRLCAVALVVPQARVGRPVGERLPSAFRALVQLPAQLRTSPRHFDGCPGFRSL